MEQVLVDKETGPVWIEAGMSIFDLGIGLQGAALTEFWQLLGNEKGQRKAWCQMTQSERNVLIAWTARHYKKIRKATGLGSDQLTEFALQHRWAQLNAAEIALERSKGSDLRNEETPAEQAEEDETTKRRQALLDKFNIKTKKAWFHH
mmetsp:Transcript_68988/g.140290  ORF Transcript_68988/g.140290 Transcript_68988/m.140290 type:complete len:148 (+) Transcript_68988:3-446(+)